MAITMLRASLMGAVSVRSGKARNGKKCYKQMPHLMV